MSDEPILLNHESMLGLWRAALREEFGVKFTVKPEDAATAMVRLYTARRESADESLSELTLRLNEEGTEFRIKRKEVQLED